MSSQDDEGRIASGLFGHYRPETKESDAGPGRVAYSGLFGHYDPPPKRPPPPLEPLAMRAVTALAQPAEAWGQALPPSLAQWSRAAAIRQLHLRPLYERLHALGYARIVTRREASGSRTTRYALTTKGLALLGGSAEPPLTCCDKSATRLQHDHDIARQKQSLRSGARVYSLGRALPGRQTDAAIGPAGHRVGHARLGARQPPPPVHHRRPEPVGRRGLEQ